MIDTFETYQGAPSSPPVPLCASSCTSFASSFQLLVGLNLQVLGQNQLCLATVFEEEHPPELTPKFSFLSSQYPQ
jgi:hypothetical protein